MPSVSRKGDTQSLTGLHPGAPWQLCTGPAETCAGSHPRSHREGGCGPKGPFSLRGVSGCVFSIAPLGPHLNTLSVTFYSQNGHFESIFHHKYADDRKIPQNRPSKFVNKNPPASPGDFYYLHQSFNRFLIISLDVLICRYSPLFRAFPTLFISEEPHKSFYYPSCFRSQK